jgi:ArsR family metal-binding transcriptional regulator
LGRSEKNNAVRPEALAVHDGGDMVLNGYRMEIFLPACNSHFQSLHCIAHLHEDVGQVIPYLNAVLGGDIFIKDPLSVTFSMHGKLVTVRSREIAVNALRDKAEAYSILEWFKKEINDAWQNRATIVPKYEGAKKAHTLTIYKLLPRTNCKACGQPTCLAFAALAASGEKRAADCVPLRVDARNKLYEYLSSFRFD